MTKNKMILSASIAAISSVGVIWHVGTREATLERFPNVDRKIAKKAYTKMILETLAGQHTTASTDEDYDKIFMDIVKDLLQK